MDLKVNNVSLYGTVKFDFSTTEATADWTSVNDAAGTSTSVAAGVTLPVLLKNFTPTAPAWGNGLLVPKQTIKTITIVYQVKNAGNWSNDMTYTWDAGLVASTVPGDDTAGYWVDGRKYTYNIKMTLNEITLSGTVTDFIPVQGDATDI